MAPVWTQLCQKRSQRKNFHLKKFSAPLGFKKDEFDLFFRANCCLNIFRCRILLIFLVPRSCSKKEIKTKMEKLILLNGRKWSQLPFQTLSSTATLLNKEQNETTGMDQIQEEMKWNRNEQKWNESKQRQNECEQHKNTTQKYKGEREEQKKFY